MAEAIRWLHLTDLHMGMGGQKWLWPMMKERFHEDLKKIHSDAGPWDLVLFTGDLVQKGSEEEYKKLDEAFGEIWSWFEEIGCRPELLAVPGNHDLVRPLGKKHKPTVAMLEKWHSSAAKVSMEFWDDEYPYQTLVRDAFANYTNWWNRTPHRPKTIRPGILPGDFSYTFEKGDLRLGIIGLNSTFLQLTDKRNYRERLVIEPRQCVEVTPNENHVEWAHAHQTCFLMTHQPMEWIHPIFRKAFHQEAMECFSLHLCGHQHETEVTQLLSGGGDHAPLQWVGRSLFGLEKALGSKINREHGYVAGGVLLEDGGAGIRFMPRRREEQGNSWGMVPDAKGVALSDDDRHTRVFSIRWRNQILPSIVTGSQLQVGNEVAVVGQAVAASSLGDVSDSVPVRSHEKADSFDTVVLRAKNITSAAMAEVWRNFQNDEEPYRSLRRALAVGDMPKAEAVRQIESMMMANILDVLGKLKHWLKQQDRIDGVTAIRKIVDALAATGMAPDLIAGARMSLNEPAAMQGNIRIAVPNWTDGHLSEVILSAIYDEPAIWAVDRYIDLDFSQIEFEDQVSDKTKFSIRKQFSLEVFGVVTRRAGEDESAYQKRLKERTGDHLIATLCQRLHDREPHHFLLDSSAHGVKKIMEADSPLWRFVVCLEQTPQGGGDDLVNDLLREMLTEIFAKLDALRDVR